MEVRRERRAVTEGQDVGDLGRGAAGAGAVLEQALRARRDDEPPVPAHVVGVGVRDESEVVGAGGIEPEAALRQQYAAVEGDTDHNTLGRGFLGGWGRQGPHLAIV